MKVETIIDTKKKVISLYDVANDTGDFISLIQTAFIYNKSKLLQGCKAQAENSRKEIDQLSTIITAYALDDPDLKPYKPLPAHIIGIWKSLEKLSELTAKKIEGNILFSDKAADETIFLLQRLIEILRPTADMILARNTFLSKYIVYSHAGVEKMAKEYATLHEDRLIAGECMPEAASIFVKMMEAIKDIAWNAKEIAVKLAG
jgi:Na+/phosphate symporter